MNGDVKHNQERKLCASTWARAVRIFESERSILNLLELAMNGIRILLSVEHVCIYEWSTLQHQTQLGFAWIPRLLEEKDWEIR